MTDSTSTSTTAPSGRFIVDIRIFMLSMTIAMCASFFAGVTMGGADEPVGHHPSSTLHHPLAPIPPLDLSEKIMAQSLQRSPSGQHLLVDISGVERAFLNSEHRLTSAMVQTIQDIGGLTMLSHHCHKLSPEGISCVGVLLESHISFHTWPEEGVITLDLFTCGSHPLLPKAVEIISTLFGIPRAKDTTNTSSDSDNEDEDEEEPPQVRVKWSHELRGFRPADDNATARTLTAVDGYSDLSYMVLSPLDVYSKEQIYSNLTKFHRVDIWDIVEVRNEIVLFVV